MLVRMDVENKAFNDLVQQWSAVYANYAADDFSNYSPPHMELAAKIQAENPPDKKYGVFAIKKDDEFLALMHINCARLPKTDGITLRMLWLLLSPKYDYEEVSGAILATIATFMIVGAVQLATTDMPSQRIKIQLGNTIERSYFTGVAVALTATKVFKEAAVRGNWLEIVL
jgi:hypothetical protein